MFQTTPYRRRQAGTTLIEVLIALLVLSFGMLGIAALQMRAIQNGNSALVRGNFSQVNVMFGESLTANRFGARYLCSNENTQEERDLRSADITYWQNYFPQGNGAGSARAGASCSSPTTYMYNLWFRWDDSRAVGGSSDTRIGLYYAF
jgi:type IV pilus assembly protein PilV